MDPAHSSPSAYNHRILWEHGWDAPSSSPPAPRPLSPAPTHPHFESDDSGDRALLAGYWSPMASPPRAPPRRRVRPKISTAFDTSSSPSSPLARSPTADAASNLNSPARPAALTATRPIYNGGLDLFSALRTLDASSSNSVPISPTPSPRPGPRRTPSPILTHTPPSPSVDPMSPVKVPSPVRKKRPRTPQSRAFSRGSPAPVTGRRSPVTPLKKASSVFDSAEFLETERRALVGSTGWAGNSTTDKNMRKKYQRFFKKLQEPAALRPSGSPPAPRPRARGRAQPVDNAQPSVATFFRAPSDSDEELAPGPTAPAPADSDDGWPTIDELIKTSDDEKPEDPAHVQRLLAQARENIQRYEEREQEREKAREEKERAESLAQTRQAVIDKENIAFRERLDVELDEDRTRQAIRGNFQYLQDVWDGKVESKRYQIFKKGGPPAHALMFQMITDPFSDQHLDWIMAEIQKKWMPNERLHAIHNDFVWKVILAEALIKIYADMFDLSKEEAELRINQTPLRPEHGGSNFIT